ncbi:MAG: hypothetical protein H6741_27340 [Alphaproteobacteria bacterium]|nr:hypothetical protein [Alphaproteobacteria bacterium]
MIALLLLWGCLAEVRDPCVEDPALCPACEADDECVFQGNPCLETVDCAHREAGLAYIQIGCSPAQEKRWPADDQCVCEASVCRSAD